MGSEKHNQVIKWLHHLIQRLPAIPSSIARPPQEACYGGWRGQADAL